MVKVVNESTAGLWAESDTHIQNSLFQTRAASFNFYVFSGTAGSLERPACARSHHLTPTEQQQQQHRGEWGWVNTAAVCVDVWSCGSALSALVVSDGESPPKATKCNKDNNMHSSVHEHFNILQDWLVTLHLWFTNNKAFTLGFLLNLTGFKWTLIRSNSCADPPDAHFTPQKSQTCGNHPSAA